MFGTNHLLDSIRNNKKNDRRRREHRKRKRRFAFLEGLESRQLLAAAPFSTDFEAFTGSGFESSPAAGQLDSDDWRATGLSVGAGTFGGSHSTNDFARGTSGGGVGTGGVYAFNTGSNTILGVQPGGSDFTPGEFTLAIQNTSGSTINNWDISYDIFYNNNGDNDRDNSLNLRVSDDDSSYDAIAAADFTTPGANDALGWQSVNRSVTVNKSIADGNTLYVQWRGNDVSGGGSRDEYGIDNVSVSAAGGTSFAIAPVNAVQAEGDAGTTAFTFEITRSGDTSGTNSVTWTKVDVDTDAADFSGTLTDTETFLATETTKLVTINVVGDTTNESNEDFTVDLSAATGGAGIVSGSATGTIQDDDTPLSSAVINEFVFNHTGADLDEYIEIFGAASEDLSAYSVLVLDADLAGGTGTISNVLSLGTSNAAGYQLAGGGVQTGGTFSNGDQSILLVRGFSGTAGQDLDTDDDGNFDVTPWSNIIDDVAVSDGFSTNPYSTTELTPALMNDGNPFTPGGASRIPNGTDTDTAADWRRNDFDGDGLPQFGATFTTDPFEAVNTPGAGPTFEGDANTSVEPSPGMIVNESGGSTDVSEAGGTDTFSIGFNTNPASSVTVTVTPDSQIDLGAGAGVAIMLTFTDRLPQDVTVSAVDDLTVEAAIHTGAISISTASSDTDYDGLVGSVTANIADNDTPAPATYLNEYVIDHRGADTDNFVEVRSTPSAVLSTLTVLVVDGDGGTVGRIEQALSLGTANAAGFATVSGVDIFNDVSLLLVEGFTGAVNDDLDTNDDGTFDSTPWTTLRDAVSTADDSNESFGFVQLSPSAMNDGNTFDVSGASRIPDATGPTTAASEWVRNDFEGLGLPSYPFDTFPSLPGQALNTPGAAFEGATNALISGIGVTETFGSTDVEEGGASDSVLLSLDGQPVTGSVTVTITPDSELDLGSGAGVAVTRVFSASNGPLSVSIDADDDAATEGPHTGTLMFEITASTDANYPVSSTAPDLSVNITDNEAGGGTPNVVISEIMYNPASSEPLGEWVEIVNTGSAPVSISGWMLDDEDTSGWGAIPSGTLGIGTTDRIAIIHNDAVSSATFIAEWGVPAGVTVVGVPWASLAQGASATNEVLQLLDGSSALIDEANYENGTNGWPGDNGTASIYLTDLAADNDVGANWDLHDVTAAPAQTPTPINPTGPTFITTDEGSPGLVPPITPGAITVSVVPGANGYEEGPIDGRFEVVLTGTDAVATVVTYTLSGSAASPGDFAALSGTVTIPAGQTTADIDVSVIDDPTFEGTEDLTLTLDMVTSGTATIAGTPATIEIFDNETATGFNLGDVIVNEIMKDPDDVFDSDGEYFELYNTTGSAIDINGWEISDNGSDSFTVVNGGPLSIPAGGYLVLGVNDDTATNGNVPVDYEYDLADFELGNGDDEVILKDALGTEIDRVEYTDATFPDVTGASLEFLPSLLGGGDDHTQNDDGLNWQAATTVISGGVNDLGTPGLVNSAPAPEINVTDNGTDGDDDPDEDIIADGDMSPSLGDGTNFGAVVIGNSDTHTFKIENEGAAALTVSAITTSGTDAAQFVAGNFSVALPAVIPAGGTMTFDVVYTPVGLAGTRTATVEITSDDANENPYDFELGASATVALAPEITVESNFEEIVDGDLIAGDNPNDDNTDFGSVDVAVGSASETYFIVNDGTADLTVTNITIGGAHATDFALDVPFAGPVVIAPGNNFDFQVNFDPSATGQRDAIVTITNDDADEGTYDYAIVGNGVNATTDTVLINEVDSNTPGADDQEFIELFGPGGTSLDGLVLVLFNGANDESYDSIDLDGLSIPADGYFVIGNALASNVDLVIPDGTVQNGADAVALYTGDGTAFPFGTAATTTNLRDAIVYDTNDGDDAALLAALGETVQFDEAANGLDDTESLQRIPNGTDGDNFTAIAPTPGAVNGAGDVTPPTVTDIKVAGSSWSSLAPLFDFLDAVDPGVGEGYSVVTNTPRVLPWTNIDTIIVNFSEDIGSFDATDFSLGGVPVSFPPFGGPVGDYELAGLISSVSYNATTFQATISLSSAFGGDKLLFSLFASTITDLAGNQLDGDANGTGGDDLVTPFDVLPGDAAGGGSVTSGDVSDVLAASGQIAGFPPFNIFADLDGSGGVNSGDFSSALGQSGTLLPLNAPVAPPQAVLGGSGGSLTSGLDDDDEQSWAELVDSLFSNLG